MIRVVVRDAWGGQNDSCREGVGQRLGSTQTQTGGTYEISPSQRRLGEGEVNGRVVPHS